MRTTPETQDDQQTEKQPGHPAKSHRTAESETQQSKGSIMTESNAYLPVPEGFEPSGQSITELEALADGIGVRVEDHHELKSGYWGTYNHRYKTIKLLSSLGRIQRRCVLAEMMAHARVWDASLRAGEQSEVLELAARLIITPEDWEVIGPVWETCKDDDPVRVFRQCRVLPNLVRAYAETTGSWCPEECINWLGFCGRGDDDDIHGFAPSHLKVSDSAVSVSQTVSGAPGGEYPVEVGMELALHAPVMKDNHASIHFDPQQAREFALFILDQADAADAWATKNSHLLDGERATTNAESTQQTAALAGMPGSLVGQQGGGPK